MRFKDYESPRHLTKQAFAELEPALRADLINSQFDLLSGKHPVALLITGDDHDGCQEVFDLLHEWLDARQLDTEVFVRRTHHERQYPFFWRYWNAVPRRGHVGLFYGHWVHELVTERFLGEMSKDELKRRIAEVCDFERSVAADGTVIRKLWIHTPRKELKQRLLRVKQRKHGWLAAAEDRLIFENYKQLVKLGEALVNETHATHAPWIVVDGRDDELRDLTVLETLRDALHAGPCTRLARPQRPAGRAGRKRARVKSRLAGLCTPPRGSQEALDARLADAQALLSDLSYRASKAGLASVLAFEGWDAAGKGGAIRRMTRAMAARDYRVVQIAAPSDEERARHYLWRFWRRVPRKGRMTIFDRSWYGRVLVERVEGLAREDEWRRAYAEIAAFEQELVADGVLLQKFWLEIDADEQLRRFEERESTAYKRYKITAEDYRNREKWDAYAQAADEMITRTHAKHAPWLVVPANDKHAARVLVVEAVCAGLERALGR